MEGRTVGSFKVSSKLGTKSTVFLSRSFKIVSEILASLTSVYLIAAGESPSTEPKFPCPSISGYLIEKS